MNHLYTSFILLFLLLMAGCQSTGNPREGGLFGWDEKKAQQRQQAMKEQHERQQQDISAVEDENSALKQKVDKNDALLVVLNNALAQLLQEQNSLREQLAQLHQENAISSEKLNELEAKYTWLNINDNKLGDKMLSIEKESLTQELIDQMGNENKSLVEEILLLIGN